MKVVCFDLDDTLYKEICYLKAAFRIIAMSIWADQWFLWYEKMMDWYNSGENVFDIICSLKPDVEKGRLLNMYRCDVHRLTLAEDVRYTLETLKQSGVVLGMITDGRTITQNNKIEALGLNKFFNKDMIIISESFGTEKPCADNYQYFMSKFRNCDDFTYVGDNPKKDFVSANMLGWNTVCLLDDGSNIHKQTFDLDIKFLPYIKIKSITELL